jgi:hypothetical protein
LPRNPLVYSLSSDAGYTWSAPTIIDDQPGYMLIYPSITQIGDNILIAYSYIRDPGNDTFSMSIEDCLQGGGKACLIRTKDMN